MYRFMADKEIVHDRLQGAPAGEPVFKPMARLAFRLEWNIVRFNGC
jgi:hypothetical protein